MSITHCFHVLPKVFYTLILAAMLFPMQVMAVPVSATPPVGTTHQWTGATSTDWNLASNWDVNTVPASTSIVFIHAAPVNQPVVTTTVSIADLNNEAGSLLTLKSLGAFRVANGFVNHGTIELGPWSGTAGNSTLTITTGTLSNAGTLTALATTNNSTHVLNAFVVNTGTITLNENLLIKNSGRTFDTTGGTVSIAAGKLLTVNAGTTLMLPGSFTGAGTVDIRGGSNIQGPNPTTVNLGGSIATPLLATGVTLTFSGDTVINAPAGSIITNNGAFDIRSDTVNVGFVNSAAGSLTLADARFNKPLSNSGTITVSNTVTLNGAFTANAGSLLTLKSLGAFTVANGFVNHGTIELGPWSGTAGNSTLTITTGTLTNAGTLTALATTNNSTHVLNAFVVNTGTITLNENLLIKNSGRTFDTTGGTVSIAAGKLLTVNAGTTLMLPGSFTGAGTVDIRGGSNIQGLNPATVNLGGSIATPLLATGVTLTFSGDTVINAPAGSNITNNGAFDIRSDTVNVGFVNSAAGSLTLADARFNKPLSNSGTITVSNTVTLNGAFTANAGSLLTLKSLGAFTVANGFVNHGTIELGPWSGTAGNSTLTITTGTLTNAGTLTALATTNNSTHVLNAFVVNTGTITLNENLLINGALLSSLAGASTVSGNGSTLSLNGGVNVFGMTVDNVLLAINMIAPVRFDNVTFQNYGATTTPLQINYSNAVNTFNNLSYNTALTSGFHIGGTGAGNTITIATNNITGTTATTFHANNTVTWSGAVNQPPFPTAPAINTNAITAGTSQINANDPNAADTFTYAVSTAPANGTAFVSPTGLATYTPNTGFTGTDRFVVTVADNGAPRKSGTVTINVTVATAPNQPPVPTAPAINTAFATAGTTQIAANDPNPADTFTYAVSTAPLNGAVSVSSTGLTTYTPNTGFSGTDSVVVTVTDAAGATGMVTINVTVAAFITTPRIAAGGSHTVALQSDGTVVAWGINFSGQTTIPAGLTNVTAIAAGGGHTVALQSDGTAVAWGRNTFGQITIPAGLTNVTAIAAGLDHTVALQSDGTVVAWGRNTFGQTTIPAGLTNVTAIAAGEAHTVALQSDGTVVAWGSNSAGQTTIPAGLTNVTAIAAGSIFSVALQSDGTVVAWGHNAFGQTTIPAGLTDVTAIAAGSSHTVALQSDGTVVAWGHNTSGQTTIPAGLTNVTAIAAGGGHTVALQSDGTVVAWGRNVFSQTAVPAGLLLGTTPGYPAPTAAAINTAFAAAGTSQIAVNNLNAGNTFTYAVSTAPLNGTVSVSSTGLATYTPITGFSGADSFVVTVTNGTGGTATVTINVTVGGFVSTLKIAAGASHTVALKSDGTVVAWGSNSLGQTNIPTGLANVTAIAAGKDHTVALKLDGTVVAWGFDGFTQATVPAGLTGVTAIAAGWDFSVALKSNGTIVPWGFTGVIGNPPAGLTGVTAIAAGGNFMLALKQDGTVVGWGSGPGAFVPAGLTGVIAITANGSHGAALKSSGVVVIWGGSNAFKALNIPPAGVSALTPMNLIGVTAIATGYFHTVALKPDGTVMAWGRNTSGQITIPAGLTNVTAIAAGANYTVALKSDGTVVSWGVAPIVPVSVAQAAPPANRPPAPTAPAMNTAFATAGTSQVTANDPDAADTLTYTVSTVPTRGTVSVSPTGLATYTPNTGFSGTDSFVVTVTDAAGATGTVTINLTVAVSSNVAPFPTAPAMNTAFATAGTSQINANDPNTVDTFTYAVSSLPANGTAFVSPTGLTTYTPNTGFSGTDRFVVTVTDNGAPRKSGAVTINVTVATAPNQPPVPVAPAINTAFATAGTTQIAANDPNPADTFTYAVSTVPVNGTASVSPTGLTTYTPNTGFSGTDSVVVTVTDAAGATGMVTINVTVAAFITTPRIAAGTNHTVALQSDGTVVAWGNNSAGQTTIPAGLTNVTAIAAGNNHTVALQSDGTIVAWGNNQFGQITIPAGLTNVTAIAAGRFHTVALQSDGTVVAWGQPPQITIPAGLMNVSAIAAGWFHTVALQSDGTVVAWGNNSSGQITIPAGLTNVTAIAAGNAHTVALQSDGTVVAWGDNTFGQITIPAGLTNVTAIAAGSGNTVALKSDGTVVAWGRNTSGQTTIPTGLTNVTAIAAGSSYTVALQSDGTVVAWGRNVFGQTTVPAGLLLGTTPGYLAPTAAAINTTFATAGTSQVSVNNPNAANTFTYAVSTMPTNGTATVSSTGLATYTPNTGFAGADSFVVTVTDNGTPRNSGRVTISVSVAAAFVVDTTAPVITMLGQSPVSVIQGITYTDAGATALDNVDGNLTGSMIVNNLVNTSVLGSYTVTYNVADTAGNGALQVTRTVNVVVDKPPVITLIGATPVTIVRSATYNDRGATAIDDVDGNITSKIAIINHVNSAVVATYTVTYDVSDAAGQATAQVVRTVNVIPPGGAANADEAVQVPLTGSAVSAEVYSAGQVISNFSATGPTGTPPAGIAFPFGAISYTTTVPAGISSQTVNLSFSRPLPANFTLYKVDGAGAYRIIPNGIGVDQWTQLDAATIALTLKDGGTFDLDGVKNGIIVDPVAVGAPPASLAVSNGGGGGCTINQSATFDPAMLLLILFSFAWLMRREIVR